VTSRAATRRRASRSDSSSPRMGDEQEARGRCRCIGPSQFRGSAHRSRGSSAQ
jgi:hypothetical protein